MELDFYFKGYSHAMQNAEDLIQVSESAALTAKFGIARSLNVLAAEEGIKAAILITKHYYPNAEIKDFKEIFKNHIIKHTHLKTFVEMITDVKSKVGFLFKNVTTPAVEFMESLPQDFRDSNKVEYDSIRLEHNFYKSFAEDEMSGKEILKWLSHANDIKNQGLYVGKNETKWFVPNDALKEDFEREKTYTSQIIKAVANTAKVYTMQQKNVQK